MSRLHTALISFAALAILALDRGVLAQTTDTPVLNDVTDMVPENVAKAKARCDQFSQLLASETGQTTTQQKKAYWPIAVSCLLAQNIPLNHAFLAQGSTIPRTHANVLVSTKQAIAMLVELRRLSDGRVVLASVTSPVVVGGNDSFKRADGSIGYYKTPLGWFRVLAKLDASQMKRIDAGYATVGGIYLGKAPPVPTRGAEEIPLTEYFLHDWLGQKENEGIFALPTEERYISHFCIRTTAEFTRNMLGALKPFFSTVYVSPEIPAFPLAQGAQR